MPSSCENAPPDATDMSAGNVLDGATSAVKASSRELAASVKEALPNAPAPSLASTSAIATDEAPPIERRFEDLALSELLELMLRSPRRTWLRLKHASDSAASIHMASVTADAAPLTARYGSRWSSLPSQTLTRQLISTKYVRLYLYSLAILLAFVGSVFARGTQEIPRGDEYSLHFAAPYLWLGFLLWLAADNLKNLTQVRSRWRSCTLLERSRLAAWAIPALIVLPALHLLAQSMAAPAEVAGTQMLNAFSRLAGGIILWLFIELVFRLAKLRQERVGIPESDSQRPMIAEQSIVERQPSPRRLWSDVSRMRRFAVAMALACSVFVWTNTSENRIEWNTILIWLLSIVLWGLAFAPQNWNLFDWMTGKIDAWRFVNWRSQQWLVIVAILIMLLGFNLRFSGLESSPPQLIGDHVENIKDAFKMRNDGYSPIRFTDYNSRDPLHYYLLVALSHLPGLQVDRYAFSLLSAIEGLITLPILYWLGRELMGMRRNKFGSIYGLLVMALAAVSLWHITLSRQGLRVTLCPLFVASSLIFYTRALRHNRRSDYVKAGFLLGFGLLSYQAVQMLPVVYGLGLVIALLGRRLNRRSQSAYIVNFVILALAAFIVFLPQFHFWVEYPDIALGRQIQGVFGSEPGTIVQGIDYIGENVLTLLGNFRRNLLTLTYHGESVWIAGMYDEPLADPLTAGFFVLGVAAWLVAIATTRDPAILLIPLALALMLLVPSFAIARPIESQHNMRASGALAPAFLIAALPLAIFCWRIYETLPKRIGPLVAVVVAAGAVLYTCHYNSEAYFVRYTNQYLARARPHREAGRVLQAFAESDGSYGNAFIIYSPHWWDARAVGMEGGQPRFANSSWVHELPESIRGALDRRDDLRLDPNRDLLFFYSKDNQEAPLQLSNWFPLGRPFRHDLELESKSFYTYRVPALGIEALDRFLETNA